MIEAGVQAGYPRTDDLNGYQQEGFGPMDRTVTPQGRRASTARGYLDQAKSRPNLTIRTHAMTDHIIFDCKRAVGVEWLEGDSTIPTRATANKEVLLCAGAIASPQILQRSGVGNAELLAEFDIPLVHDLPGVGENLQDHLEMYLQYECKNRFPSTLPCSGGISRKSVRSGCLAAPALVPATTLKQADLFAAERNLRGRIFSITSCR